MNNNKRPLPIDFQNRNVGGFSKLNKTVNTDVHNNLPYVSLLKPTAKPPFKGNINKMKPLNNTTINNIGNNKILQITTSNSNSSNSSNSNASSTGSKSTNSIEDEIEVDDIDLGSPFGSGYPSSSQLKTFSFDENLELEQEIIQNINNTTTSQVSDLKFFVDQKQFHSIPSKPGNKNFRGGKSNRGGRYRPMINSHIEKDTPKIKLPFPDMSTITNNIEDIICKVYQLPKCISDIYSERGIKSVYDWQRELLCKKNVLDGENFVYSLPTSGGKTFVSEVCLLKNIILDKKKSIFIFPFISIVTEKARSLRDFSDKLNFYTDSYYSSEGQIPVPFGPRMLICTIEKANIVVNQMIEDNRLHEVGCVVIDEIHMIGDNDRGVILELLISKLIYAGNSKIQIIGMSATVPNIIHLAQWFRGLEYQCNYRPVPLTEFYRFGANIYNNKKEIVKNLIAKDDYGQIAELCNEVVPDHSVLVFCPSKQLCVETALAIAKRLPQSVIDQNKDNKDNMVMIMESAIGGKLSQNDTLMIKAGVYYHNSNLTNDEREVVENHFKNHTILILCATSTLSAGVNLPARRVILKSPKMGTMLLSPRNYKQMCGRAGRAGIDTFGESFILTDKHNLNHTEKLVTSPVEKLVSLLDQLNQWERIALESICTNIATNIKEIIQFINYTFYSTNPTLPKDCTSPFDYYKNKVEKAVESLLDRKYIEIDIKIGTPITQQDEILKTKELIPYKTTKIGLSSFKSTLSIGDNDKIFTELKEFQLKPIYINEPLHICYLCTPLIGIPTSIDWEKFHLLFISLSESKKNVATIIGINGQHIIDKVSYGGFDLKVDLKYVRFFYALALTDLIQEAPLFTTANRYSIDRGSLQSIMQNASGYSYTLGLFCQTHGWSELNSLITLYIKRLDHGVREDIIPLLEIPGIRRPRARILYNAGFKTIKSIAVANPEEIGKCLKIIKDIDEPKRIINAASRVLERKSEELRVKVGEFLINKPNHNTNDEDFYEE